MLHHVSYFISKMLFTGTVNKYTNFNKLYWVKLVRNYTQPSFKIDIDLKMTHNKYFYFNLCLDNHGFKFHKM